MNKKLLTLLILLITVIPLLAQEDNISPALNEQLDRLEDQVEDIRDLELTQPVNRKFPTSDEALEFIYGALEEELDEQIVFEETLFYRALDFVEDDFDLAETYFELLGSQVAGYYDPETQDMNTLLITGEELTDSLPLLERIIYAHEYTHALQDEAYDLDAYLLALDELDPDQVLAAQAVVEGDATLVMQEYLTQLTTENPAVAVAALGQILALSSSGIADIPAGTPAILEAELTLPYLSGQNFVTTLRNQGGWNAVDAAFANPPRSTEQILHPESYFNGDEPVDVVLNSVDDLFDDNWSVILERRLGEFYLREHIKTQLSNASAIRGAAGWGGDLFRLYYNDTVDSLAWVLRVVWDTPNDTIEFREVYTLLAEKLTEVEATIYNDIICWQLTEHNKGLCLANFSDDSIVSAGPDITTALHLAESQR